MPFELHTWGPAFSLPSLDPDCLAAIAYLRLALPPDTWVLIPTSDTSISPTRDLPALKDGDVVVGGFQNIVNYLARISNGQWDLDSPKHFPSPLTRADIIAFQSHIPTHAHPLLSLLLYLSPKNYSHVTRPAYTPLLPWPAQYIIPPQQRSVARKRCEHIGVQGVDLDDADDDEEGEDAEQGRRRQRGGGSGVFGRDGMISDALSGGAATGQQRKTTTTVTSLLQSRISGPRSIVSSLIDTLCIPLTALLSNNNKQPYLLNPSTHPSTTSCLALGYLSLLLIPSLPVSWPQQQIRQRYPTLASFVERGVRDIYGGETDVEEALEGGRRRGDEEEGLLPWRKRELVGAKMAERMIWGSVLDQVVPIFNGGNILPMRGENTDTEKDREGEGGEVPMVVRNSSSSGFPLFPAVVIAMTTAVAAAGIGYFYYYGGVLMNEKEKRLSDMGEAGALFAGLEFGRGRGEVMAEEGEARGKVVPVVGVEVDVSGDREG